MHSRLTPTGPGSQATKPRMEIDNPISDPAVLEGELRAAVVTGAGQQQQDYARALAVAEAAELLIQVRGGHWVGR